MHIWLKLQILFADSGYWRRIACKLVNGVQGVFRVHAQQEARNVARARIVRAIAHPTRMFLADELARHGRKCVCQLTAMIGADTSTVSRHLSVLRNAGILIDTKEGAQVFYELAFPGAAQLLDCVDCFVRAAERVD